MFRGARSAAADEPRALSVTDARGRFFAPDDAWIHADDLLIPERQRMETRYVHGAGEWKMSVPLGPLEIKVVRGPGFAVVRRKVDAQASVTVTLPRLAFPGKWWSGDLHVHMNYGGRYRNTPANLAKQARAEGLDLVYNLVVNKEQRVPDVAPFLPAPDPASSGGVLLLHGEEFHSSYWGHIRPARAAATTSPIYVRVGGRPRRSRPAATWALHWLDRLAKATLANPDYLTTSEREAVLQDISRASGIYKSCSAEQN